MLSLARVKSAGEFGCSVGLWSLVAILSERCCGPSWWQRGGCDGWEGLGIRLCGWLFSSPHSMHAYTHSGGKFDFTWAGGSGSIDKVHKHGAVTMSASHTQSFYSFYRSIHINFMLLCVLSSYYRICEQSLFSFHRSIHIVFMLLSILSSYYRICTQPFFFHRRVHINIYYYIILAHDYCI